MLEVTKSTRKFQTLNCLVTRVTKKGRQEEGEKSGKKSGKKSGENGGAEREKLGSGGDRRLKRRRKRSTRTAGKKNEAEEGWQDSDEEKKENSSLQSECQPGPSQLEPRRITKVGRKRAVKREEKV